MTQHTPGPWATSRDGVPEDHIQITIYAEATGKRVATAFETEANAALIAAAPETAAERERLRAVNAELVAALTAIEEAACSLTSGVYRLQPKQQRDRDDIIKWCKAALAKAAGGGT